MPISRWDSGGHRKIMRFEMCVMRCGKPSGRLGFMYFTDRLLPYAADTVDTVRELTGVQDWVGSVGTGILASGIEYVGEPALALMAADRA